MSSFTEGMQSRVHEIGRMWTARRLLDKRREGLVRLSPEVARQLEEAAGRNPSVIPNTSVITNALAQGLNRWVDAAVDRRTQQPDQKGPDFSLVGRIHGNGSAVDLGRYAGHDLHFTSSARDQAEGTAQAYRDLVDPARPETDIRFSFGLIRNLKDDPIGAEKDYFDPKHPGKKRYYDGRWIHDPRQHRSRFDAHLKPQFQRDPVFFNNDEPVLSQKRFNQSPDEAIEAMRPGPGQPLNPGAAALEQVRKIDVGKGGRKQLGWLASDGHDHLHAQFGGRQRSNIDFAAPLPGTTAMAEHSAGLRASILRATNQVYRPRPAATSAMARHSAGLQASILRAANQVYRPRPVATSAMARHSAGLQASILRAANQISRRPPTPPPFRRV